MNADGKQPMMTLGGNSACQQFASVLWIIAL
jgi:hypothetical protein